ncbi:MAG: SatD family protein [Gammaproteobacteria bacterium]|jgi:Mor family transcriptional regulator
MSKIVLIGDIIASRKIKDRSSVQKQLKAAIRQLNRKNPNLLSPYTITLGDEFQAVFDKADRLFSDIINILFALYPEQVRFSVGVGAIDTPINKQQAIGMDGQAFYLARKGIEQLKASGYLFIANGLGENQQDMVNNSLFLISHHVCKWKPSRLAVFRLLQQGMSVADMTSKLDLTDKAIYKTIDQGELKVIRQLFLEIEKIITAFTMQPQRQQSKQKAQQPK